MMFRKELESKIHASGFDYRQYQFPENVALTYAGVLVKYFEPEEERDRYLSEGAETNPKSIIQRWIDDEYIANCINDYVNVILPEIDGNKALEDYTREDFDSILERIEEKRGSQVKDKRIKHFKYLLTRVYLVGVRCGVIDNTIDFDQNPIQIDLSDSDESEAKVFLRPKSLSLEHELNILRRFKNSNICDMPGEELGAYMQFFTGGRNAEVAALTYGVLRVLSSGRRVLYIYMTSRGSKGKLSLRMKTSNARRVVPVFDFLAKRLEERMKFIQEKYPDKDVSTFQIACRDCNYDKAMNPNRMTEFGRKLILDTSPRTEDSSAMKRMLAYLSVEGIPIEEKSPTAYLFRRNYATHLHNLGLNPSAVEYIIGHEIMDPNDSRNQFSTEESLEMIHEAFDDHPFNYFFPEDRISRELKITGGNRIKLTLEPGIRYRLMLNEPNDETVFDMDENFRKNFMVTVSERAGRVKDTVDITGLVNPSYLPNDEKSEDE